MIKHIKGVTLTHETANKLKQFLGSRDGFAVNVPNGGEYPFWHLVKITGERDDEDGGLYPCQLTHFDVETDDWIDDEDTPCKVREPNGFDFLKDRRYAAKRYGVDTEGNYLFEAQATTPILGCHFDWEDIDGVYKLMLNLQHLLGRGLKEVDESGSGSSGSCPKIEVKLGSCLEFTTDGKIKVKADCLGGTELLAGCGITITEEDDVYTISIDLTDVAFDGLYWNNEICALGINFGCHLALQSDEAGDKIFVDVRTMINNGLEIVAGDTSDSSSGNDCDTIRVKADCGIQVTADGVGVKRSDLLGACLVADTGCKIKVDTSVATTYDFTSTKILASSGCGFNYEETTYTVKKNACGLVVDITAGSTDTKHLSLPGCCDCSSDSGSISHDESSIGGSGGGLGCCTLGGTIHVNLAGCAALNGSYALTGSSPIWFGGSGDLVITASCEAGHWVVSGSCGTEGPAAFALYGDTGSCDPFSVSLTGTIGAGDCCGGGADLTGTLSE